MVVRIKSGEDEGDVVVSVHIKCSDLLRSFRQKPTGVPTDGSSNRSDGVLLVVQTPTC